MPEILNFKPHKSGDTFSGRTITILIGPIPANLTGATIQCDFRQNSPEGPVALTMTNGTGITITNPTAGIFQFDSQIIDMPAGIYFYDIEIRFQNGTVKTYIEGTWLILPSITN